MKTIKFTLHGITTERDEYGSLTPPKEMWDAIREIENRPMKMEVTLTVLNTEYAETDYSRAQKVADALNMYLTQETNGVVYAYRLPPTFQGEEWERDAMDRDCAKLPNTSNHLFGRGVNPETCIVKPEKLG
jgi:hypothetical protein